jgi:hypothetical protein
LNDEEALGRLAIDIAGAEIELDLRGLDLAEARAAIDRMLAEERRAAPRGAVVRIDPATETSGETLFQPVGRLLLQAMKDGLATRCSPIPGPAAAGFYVELTGTEPADGAADV